MVSPFACNLLCILAFSVDWSLEKIPKLKNKLKIQCEALKIFQSVIQMSILTCHFLDSLALGFYSDAEFLKIYLNLYSAPGPKVPCSLTKI